MLLSKGACTDMQDSEVGHFALMFKHCTFSMLTLPLRSVPCYSLKQAYVAKYPFESRIVVPMHISEDKLLESCRIFSALHTVVSTSGAVANARQCQSFAAVLETMG